MDRRRIALYGTAGDQIAAMDVSAFDHANASIAIRLVVETRCDMGEWHSSQVFDVAPWGARLADPPPWEARDGD